MGGGGGGGGGIQIQKVSANKSVVNKFKLSKCCVTETLDNVIFKQSNS